MGLEARDLLFSYDEARVLDGVGLELRAGEVVGLVGPNGAGKTTLIHLLFGLLAPAAGEVLLDGRPLSGLDRKQIARRAALVPQEIRSDFAFTVRELVAMGRIPHLGRFEPEGPGDLEAIDQALRVTETSGLAERMLSELSGGERQRVHIARAIAQQTPILLLDEPIANLDVEHQLHVLDMVRSLVAGKKAVMMALHDLSLAARFCDRIVLLADRKIRAAGAPDAVITEETLARYFRIRARIERDPADGFLVVVPLAAMPRPGHG